jgi:hypothetical protein
MVGKRVLGNPSIQASRYGNKDHTSKRVPRITFASTTLFSTDKHHASVAG